MKKSNGFNYEMMENCIDKFSNVKTIHRYGNLDSVREPFITVLIPTYKRSDLIKDAIDSALKQYHVPFFWDIVILDNEPFDGIPNATEDLIKKIDNPRILYYRNTEHLRPGDNFNRGISIARGKWVVMLHDDDILVYNTIQNIERAIRFLEASSKQSVGAISVGYYQFKYDPANPNISKKEIDEVQGYLLSQPTNYKFRQLTHKNILYTSHIGGDVPTNGTTFNREAVLRVGGFNDDFGIMADLILFYCLENYYSVYSTNIPYGFYRWGTNLMVKPESTREVIQSGYDFREYVYSKNIMSAIWGKLFRNVQYDIFTSDVIAQKNNCLNLNIVIDDYNDINSKRSNRIALRIYKLLNKKYIKTLEKAANKRMKNYREDR